MNTIVFQLTGKDKPFKQDLRTFERLSPRDASHLQLLCPDISVPIMQPRRQRQQRSNLALILLASQLARVGFDRIPPVTLITIVGQVVTHLRLLDLDWPSVNQVCVSAAYVWYYNEWKRCLLASFFHLDDWHLYYNMVSFLWKGISLEQHYGTGYFAFIIAVFSVLTNVVLVGLNLVMGEYLMIDSTYVMQCAAGFSGVLFALKVLTTHLLPRGTHYVLGLFPVPSRLAVWAELFFIQMMVPNASFTGHLAGILVGLMYVKGPLGPIMETFFSMFTGFSVRRRRRASDDRENYGGYYTGGQRTYYDQSGTSGYRRYDATGDRGRRPEPSAPPPAYGDVYPDLHQRNPPYPTDDYGGMPSPHNQHGGTPYPPDNQGGMPYPPEDHRGMPYPQAPDMERMRSARLNRFQ